MFVEPTVLEEGGRSEVLEASGVLFLFPMMLLAIADYSFTGQTRVTRTTDRVAVTMELVRRRFRQLDSGGGGT